GGDRRDPLRHRAHPGGAAGALAAPRAAGGAARRSRPRRCLVRAVACAAILLLPTLAHALTLDEAIAEAERRDPALRALAEEATALEGERRAAGRLLADDPEVELGAGVRFLDEGRVFEWEASVEQPLRLGGHGRARREAADAALARVAASRRERRVALQAEVRIAFTRVLAAREREAILREAAALAAEAARAADERFREGRIAKVERNGVVVEHARAARAAAEAAVETAVATAALRRLVGLEADAPVEIEGALVPAAPPAL